MQHEIVSVQMLEFLIQANDLRPEFDKYGLTEDDFEFIKEQILESENVRISSVTFITEMYGIFQIITHSSQKKKKKKKKKKKTFN